MYKFERYCQLGRADFNQPARLKMDPENRWVKKAPAIPWEAIEDTWSCSPVIQECLQSRCAWCLGSLMIQKQYGYSDKGLLEQIRENPLSVLYYTARFSEPSAFCSIASGRVPQTAE